MDIGSFAVVIGFTATIISLLGYYFSARKETNIDPNKKNEKNKRPNFFLDLGRLGYYIMTISVLIASIYLYYLILDHQFQIKYVYQYSSKDLSLGLLISTFWAGQEGSFLLWTLLTAISGVFFLRNAGKHEAKAMVFLNVIMGFFLAILIKASPFLTLSRVPVDGAGLNPLLQNFWMIIHPPILFVGYAASAFPLILALAALWRKDYDGWIKPAFPWTIFSALTLGAGIILGAFWAYETLGWGGYWGWDPVENSSLIPWLTILALIHGLLVQRRIGTLRKTNFVLAIISFVLVLYATFLTRSGILEDFSVHSFQNLGLSSYLILFMVSILVIGLGLFFRSVSEISKKPVDWSTLNRETGLNASLFVFGAAAFLTFIGTSSPIITGLLGKPSQVDISFYDRVNLPVGVLMAILLGITPFLLWIEKDLKLLPRRFLLPVVLAVVSTIVTIWFGNLEVSEIIFILAAYFALWANVIVLYRQWKISWRNIAGPLSHFGVGILFVAIIISGNYAKSERVILEVGQSKEVLNHRVTYKGLRPMDDGKNILEIQVDSESESYIAKPRLFSTRKKEVMREPDVNPGIITDIYISAIEHRPASNHSHGTQLSIVKGESKEIEGYTITFTGFKMTPHQDGNAFNVGAVLNIKKEKFEHTVTPMLIMGAEGKRAEPGIIPAENSYGKEIKVTLNGLDADKKRVDLVFEGLGTEKIEAHTQSEQLIVEFSKKPFMSIMWLGTVIIIIGTLIAFSQRVKVAA